MTDIQSGTLLRDETPRATPPSEHTTIAVEGANGGLTVRTPAYSLEIAGTGAAFASAPYAILRDAAGEEWLSLNLLSSIHTAAAADEVYAVDAIDVTEAEDAAVLLTVRLRSSAWDRHETRLRCTPEQLELTAAVAGTGVLTEVTMFGGRGMLRNGACGTFRSDARFRSVLAPAATEPVQLVRPARTPAVLTVVGDAAPGRLNAVFSPPPLVFSLGRSVAVDATTAPIGDWLGLWLRAPIEEQRFVSMAYEPCEDGFLVALDYDAHTAVDGEWISPTLVIAPIGRGEPVDGLSAIDAYRADQIASGHASGARREQHTWWLEPIFCGWGAQCARSAHVLHRGPDDPTSDTAPETEEEEPAVVRAAPGFARADVYDEFLDRLSAHDLFPGTIVIDDRWQREYGAGTVDTEHWPDLTGWIADRHAAGQKVLLWWKAWDPEGLPADECITDLAGRPVAADPGSAAYRERVRTIVSRLLSPEGLDADGFKIDFTQRGPSGHSLRGSGDSWGIAALHQLLTVLHDAAKNAKPDALVIAHAMHPSFGDVCDMVRLNDVSKHDAHGEPVPVVDQLRMRHEIASRALPHHLVDTDQWPMPSRDEWLRYADEQVRIGVPALYYLEAIDRSGEHIDADDLARIADGWARYRERVAR